MSDFLTHGRIVGGVISTPDLDAALADYHGCLGLNIVAEGVLEAGLAASWGCPKSAGARYATLQPQSGAHCFIRLVEAPLPADFKPTRTFGWAAYELTVKDVFGWPRRLEGSGFDIVGPPRELEGLPYFVPMQVTGRGREMIYLNEVADNTPTSDLPKAGSLTAIVPAIQPSSIAPRVMIVGNRSISLITNWLPQTMMGMLTRMPKITSTML